MTKNPKPLSKSYVKGYNAGLLTAESKLKQCHNDAYAAGVKAGEARLARKLRKYIHMTEQKRLDIRVAANDFRAALEEVFYLTLLRVKDQSGGGYRHEESKQRFSVAVEKLVEVALAPDRGLRRKKP